MMHSWFRLRRIRLLGAPTYVHWSLLLVVGLLGFMSFHSLPYAVVAIASYLGVIVIHEAGHAWMAQRFGCRVFAIRIAWLHGCCEYEDAVYSEREDVLIAWAGVMAQLAVALPVLAVATVLEGYELGYAAPAVVLLGYANLSTALINLAPAPGLDGQKAWRALPLIWKWWSARRAARRVVHRLTRRK
jgi:Zn-dependent protease